MEMDEDDDIYVPEEPNVEPAEEKPATATTREDLEEGEEEDESGAMDEDDDDDSVRNPDFCGDISARLTSDHRI